jgi:Tol biopolymer transport system component
VAWLDGAGKAQPLLAKPGNYGRPSVSPDGQRLALEVAGGSGTDIGVYDWRRDTMTRLTFSGTAEDPVWSPDGRYIVFRAIGEGTLVTRSDGAGKPQPLIQSKNLQYPRSFTPDGKRLAFQESGWGDMIYGPCHWRAIARDCVAESRKFFCKRWRTSGSKFPSASNCNRA